MQNIKTTSTFNLNNLLTDLQRGKFVIPDFQREFEWEAWDVRDLIKSIFQDYYIGTLLLWEVKDNNFETLACESIRGNEKFGQQSYIVLDGQQRLTAMYFAFFSPDISLSHKKTQKATFYVNIQKLESEFEDEAFFYHFGRKKEVYYESKENQFSEHVFPLKVFGQGGFEIVLWIKEYIKYWEQKITEESSEDEKVDIEEILKNAHLFQDRMNEVYNRYTVAFILLDGGIDIKKVCEIFTQINSKGVKLDIFDLLNAILKPHDLRLKELWRNNIEKITYSDDPRLKIYVLQIMSIWLQNYCSPKYLYYLVPRVKKQIRLKDHTKEEKILIQTKEKFKEHWNKAVIALHKSFSIISNSKDYGAIKVKFLPYLTIIPLFSAVNEWINSNGNIDKIAAKQKLKLFYWANVFTQNYSSSTESKSARDYVLLQNWFKNTNQEPPIIDDFRNRYKDLKLINETSQGSSVYKAILNLVVLNNARDFITYDLPDYSDLDDHHIVPSSWGKEHKIEQVNSILNRTLITRESNRNVLRNRLPNVYIQEMITEMGKEATKKLLESHFISEKAMDILLRSPFTAEDFKSFLEERQSSIIEGIESLIIKSAIKIETPKLDVLRQDFRTLEVSLRNLVNEKLSTISENPFDEFINDKVKEEIDRKIFSDLKKSPSLSFADFEPFEKKLEKLTFGELTNTMFAKKSWSEFEPIFKNKQILIKRVDQLIPFRNKYAHNNELTEVELFDAKAALDWFKEVLS